MCSYRFEVNPKMLCREVLFLVSETDWSRAGKDVIVIGDR